MTGETSKLSTNISNALKYISKANTEDSNVLDLKKALFYLVREVKQLEGKPDPKQPDLFNE